jgi:hypothetical protein
VLQRYLTTDSASGASGDTAVLPRHPGVQRGKDLTESFEALGNALKLDPQVDEQAREIRSIIDEVLTAAEWSALSLLQGSYGRKTMYPPLKDVDLVIVLPKSLAHLRTDPQGPAKAMAAFQNLLLASGRLPGIQFDQGGPSPHALQLSMPGVQFTFGLIPAFETEDLNWLVIADRKNQRWDKRSDVRGLRNKVVARNLLCKARWVPQVRMDKHALRQNPAVKALVCGLIVESLAYDAVHGPLTPQMAIAATFAQGSRVPTGVYTGLAQEDVTAKWTPAERQQVVAFFQRNHRRAEEALMYETTGDTAAASSMWREILGQEFPQVEVAFTDRLSATTRLGGGLTSTGRLTTSPAAPAATNPGRPWRRA